MKLFFRLALFGFLFSFCLSLHAEEGFYLGGIQVNEPDQEKWVDTLKNVGMNTVEVTVYAKQGDWDSDHLWFEKENKGVLHEIEVAKQKGMHVVLILRVALDHAFQRNKFLWHGMIMPKSDALLHSWFEKYKCFVCQWARIAQKYEIDVFAVGSEMRILSATVNVDALPELEHYYLDEQQQKRFLEKHRQFKKEITDLSVSGHDNYLSLERFLHDKIAAYRAWAKQVAFFGEKNPIKKINQRRELVRRQWCAVIQEVRQIYKGKVTYAANFDNYQNVAFWKELDYMGINAYFQLRKLNVAKKKIVDYEELVSSWEKILGEIHALRKSINREEMGVLFTELGYTWRKNCTLAPWAGFGFEVLENGEEKALFIWPEQEADKTERSLAIKALHQAQKQYQKLLQGILYWKLTTQKAHLEIEPFGLHIAVPASDPLQRELVQFLP